MNFTYLEEPWLDRTAIRQRRSRVRAMRTRNPFLFAVVSIPIGWVIFLLVDVLRNVEIVPLVTR